MSNKADATTIKQAIKRELKPKLRFPEFRGAPEWEEELLDDLISTTTPPKKIPTTEYLIKGLFPIIDQSQSYIAGWTNDQEAVVKDEFPLIIFGDHTCALKLANQPFAQGADGIKIFKAKRSAHTDYLYQFLQFKPVVTEEYKRHFSILKNKKIAYPEIKSGEQRKIADFLSSIDDLVAAETQKLDTLKAHKRGLMQQLFPAEGETLPKLRFPEYLDAPEWQEKQLHQIAKPVSDKATDGDNDNILTLSGEHGLVLQSDYFGKKIAGDNVERYIRIALNDFVYNDRTTKLSTYGSIKRLSKYGSGIVSPIYKCFRFSAGENPVFWDWYFESGFHEPQLHGLVNEGARAGRFNISIDKFLSTLVWHPGTVEQQKIADCLSSIDDLVAAQTQKLETLKTHKKGLMQQLFPALDEVKG